jgi:hypothetical protein
MNVRLMVTTASIAAALTNAPAAAAAPSRRDLRDGDYGM